MQRLWLFLFGLKGLKNIHWCWTGLQFQLKTSPAQTSKLNQATHWWADSGVFEQGNYQNALEVEIFFLVLIKKSGKLTGKLFFHGTAILVTFIKFNILSLHKQSFMLPSLLLIGNTYFLTCLMWIRIKVGNVSSLLHWFLKWYMYRWMLCYYI